MLEAGDPAPDFDLPRPVDGGRELYRLSAAAREGPVVVAFFPLSAGDRATSLVRALAAADGSSATDRPAVLAVGVGTRVDHERLRRALDAPVALLLDRDGYFAERYGAVEGGEVRRAVFVVDSDCVIRGAWAVDDDGLPTDAVESVVARL